MAINILAEPGKAYEHDPACAWVLDVIDEWREKTEKPRRDPGRFHASDLGASDEDLIAKYNGTYVWRGEEAQKLRVFDNGHRMHSRWAHYFKKAGLSIPHRKQFWLPRLRIKGTCDEIIAHPETGDVSIVELKSINPFGFSRLSEPHAAHVDQLHCYMHGLRIPRGMVLYENKADQAVKLFRCDFDADRWRQIEDRLLRLRREAEARVKWEDKQPPEVVAAAQRFREALEEGDTPDIRDHPKLRQIGARMT